MTRASHLIHSAIRCVTLNNLCFRHGKADDVGTFRIISSILPSTTHKPAAKGYLLMFCSIARSLVSNPGLSKLETRMVTAILWCFVSIHWDMASMSKPYTWRTRKYHLQIQFPHRKNTPTPTIKTISFRKSSICEVAKVHGRMPDESEFDIQHGLWDFSTPQHADMLLGPSSFLSNGL